MHEFFILCDYYLCMKHLNDILKESLLDDEDTLMKNADDNVYDYFLGDLKKAWRIIDKIIVYDPRDERFKSMGDQPTLYLSEDNNGRGRNDFTYDQLTNLKKAGLKFQNLEHIIIEHSDTYKLDDWFKVLPCKEVGMMKVFVYGDDLDFNNFKGKINHLIQLFPYHQGIVNGLEIVPPKYHVGLVNYGSTYSISNSSSNVKNWDCDYLLVPGYKMMCGVLDHHRPDVMCGFWIDMVQELIDANPNAKEIYVYDNKTYWRCSCKGTGKNRKLVKLTNRTEKYIDKIITEYQWKCRNEAQNDTYKLLNK